MRRKLPRAPITAHFSRRVARLPAGGATGVVCAVAGVACSVGLLVVGPAIVLPPSLDGRDRSPQPAARAIHVAAPRLEAPAGDGGAANTASGPSRGGSFPATRPAASATVDATTAPDPDATANPVSSVEPEPGAPEDEAADHEPERRDDDDSDGSERHDDGEHDGDAERDDGEREWP